MKMRLPVLSCLLFLLLHLDSEAAEEEEGAKAKAASSSEAASEPPKYETREILANVGSDLTLSCAGANLSSSSPGGILWVWRHSPAEEEGADAAGENETAAGGRVSAQPNGDLRLRDLRPQDALLYRCQGRKEGNVVLSQLHIGHLRTVHGATVLLDAEKVFYL